MQAIVTSARRPAGSYSPSVGFGEVNAAAALTAAGRLAAHPAAGPAGMAGTGYFASRFSGPIIVVRRDHEQIAALAAAAVAAAIGFLLCLALLAGRVRRRRRPPFPPAASGSPAAGAFPAEAAEMSWPALPPEPAD
jgi:hypothetical protein